MTTTTATQAELDTQAYEALQAADGNATRAAEALGLARSTFRNRIARHEARIAQDEAAEPEAQQSVSDADLAAFMAGQDAVYDRMMNAIGETATTEDPDESVTALPEDGEPAAEEITPASEQAPAEEPQPAPAKNWTRQAGRKNVEVNFPDGVVTPAAFRRCLISETLAPGTLRIQGVYNMLGRKGFPVRHYGADGGVYDAPQDRDGVRVTRPGVDLAAARDWYLAKHATQA